MSNYRESTYSLNMRPSSDPSKFPQTINTGDYFLSYPNQVQIKPNETVGVQIPTQYVNQQTAKSYAYEVQFRHKQQLQLVPDHQVLSKHQSYQQSQVQRQMGNTSQNSAIYQEIVHEDKAVRVVARTDIEDPWRNKCALLEKQIYELQQENQKYRGMNMTTEKVTYYEDTQRVNQLMTEVDRLNRLAIDLNQEIESWRQRYTSLEQQLRTRSNVESEIERMRRAVQDNENVMQMEMNRLREQLEEWQRRYNSLELQNQENQTNFQKSRTNEQSILNLQSEIKKLELALRSKTEDLETLQQKFNRLERVVRDSEYQSQETASLRRIIDERNKEIEQLRKAGGNTQQLKDMESKLALFQVECDRMNQLILNKDQELNFIRDQLKRQSQYSNSRQRV